MFSWSECSNNQNLNLSNSTQVELKQQVQILDTKMPLVTLLLFVLLFMIRLIALDMFPIIGWIPGHAFLSTCPLPFQSFPWCTWVQVTFWSHLTFFDSTWQICSSHALKFVGGPRSFLGVNELEPVSAPEKALAEQLKLYCLCLCCICETGQESCIGLLGLP